MEISQLYGRLINYKTATRSPNDLSAEFCDRFATVFKARLAALVPLVNLKLAAAVNKKIAPSRVGVDYLYRVFTIISNRDEAILYYYLVEMAALLGLIHYFETSVDNTVYYNDLKLEDIPGYAPPDPRWLPMPSSSSSSDDDANDANNGLLRWIIEERARRRANRKAAAAARVAARNRRNAAGGNRARRRARQ